jgi:hypothetical protein
MAALRWLGPRLKSRLFANQIPSTANSAKRAYSKKEEGEKMEAARDSSVLVFAGVGSVKAWLLPTVAKERAVAKEAAIGFGRTVFMMLLLRIK